MFFCIYMLFLMCLGYRICRGGKSSEVDCSAVNDPEAWAPSVWSTSSPSPPPPSLSLSPLLLLSLHFPSIDFPVSVADTVMPISELVREAGAKQRVHSALIDFLNQKRKEYGQTPMVDDKPYTHPPPNANCPPCKVSLPFGSS